MKTALIMGISGGFGGHVAQALARQGWKIRALMRHPEKLANRFQGAEVYTGDASNISDVRSAAAGVDLIVYGINPANYQWQNKVIPWLDITASVAEENKLTIVFPANVYVFNPTDGPVFDENAEINPITNKGKMREVMEQRLRDASQHGAKVIILRCGDFIGQNAPSTWIASIIKRTKQGYSLSIPGQKDIKHTWAYLPDVAQTVSILVEKVDSLPALNVFHFKGYQVSFNDIAETIQKITGKSVSLKKFPWPIVRILGLFSTLMSSLVELRYLWNTELNLSDSKLKETLQNKVPNTPLSDALVSSGLLNQPKKRKTILSNRSLQH